MSGVLRFSVAEKIISFSRSELKAVAIVVDFYCQAGVWGGKSGSSLADRATVTCSSPNLLLHDV